MSALDFEALCVPIEEAPPDLCITLPGGIEVCAQSGALTPSLFEYAKAALGAASSAMAPLGPIFTIIGTITAIQKCLMAIPGILGPPPNPAKLIEALEELALKIAEMVKLLPQFSIPLMVVQLIDVIIATLDGAASEIASISRLINRIETAQLMAGQVPDLISMIACAQTSVDTQMTNIEKSFASINPIIDVINLLGQLAGLKPIPSFEGGLPTDPAKAGIALQAAADALRIARSAIPI